MASNIFRTADGMALAIPDDIAQRYHLDEGVEVEVIPTEDGILLQPIGVAPWFSIEWEYALEDVLEYYRPALELARD
ncbi:MAG: hypothetical protein HW416_3229 [Chloroflexi bacterium]|nr:hypothetical protein [Chloroflexota bacterium]